MRHFRRWSRGFTFAALLVIATGCEARVDLSVDFAPDGSGEVTARIGVDGDVVSEVGDYAEQLRLDDLIAAGWEIKEPEVGADGWTWVEASRRFRSPGDLTAAINEVAGADGPLRDFGLAVSDELGRTTYRFDGTFVPVALEAFSDPALDATLGDRPFGISRQELERRAGRPLEETVGFSVTVTLPGEARPNSENPQTWSFSLADDAPTKMTSATELVDEDVITWRWIAFGALALVVLMALVELGLLVRRRSAHLHSRH